jgi:hypothetical protein
VKVVSIGSKEEIKEGKLEIIEEGVINYESDKR